MSAARALPSASDMKNDAMVMGTVQLAGQLPEPPLWLHVQSVEAPVYLLPVHDPVPMALAPVPVQLMLHADPEAHTNVANWHPDSPLQSNVHDWPASQVGNVLPMQSNDSPQRYVILEAVTYTAMLVNVPGVVAAAHASLVVGMERYVMRVVNVPAVVAAASHIALVVGAYVLLLLNVPAAASHSTLVVVVERYAVVVVNTPGVVAAALHSALVCSVTAYSLFVCLHCASVSGQATPPHVPSSRPPTAQVPTDSSHSNEVLGQGSPPHVPPAAKVPGDSPAQVPALPTHCA